MASSDQVARRVERIKREKEKEQERQKISKTYSVERFRQLLDYFREVQMMTPETPTHLVEKIRNLAEFLVYGQKFDSSIYFEEFIEENVC